MLFAYKTLKSFKLGIVAHTCNSRNFGSGDRNIMSSRPAWAKIAGLNLKNKK
jgi:hypothetical protein